MKWSASESQENKGLNELPLFESNQSQIEDMLSSLNDFFEEKVNEEIAKFEE